MAGEFSFDVVSEFDAQELRNALDQVRREIATRFDFKGATAEITQEKDALAILADSELRAKSIRELSRPRRSAGTSRSRSSTGGRSSRQAG